MTLRPYADNVILVLEPEPTKTQSGLAMVRLRGPGARYSRTARVVSSGPGYWDERRLRFIPNEVRAGERVVVDALAGQNYDLDLTAPRHNKPTEFQELCGEKGEFRIVREQEILAVIADGAVLGDAVPTAQAPRIVDLSDEPERAMTDKLCADMQRAMPAAE